ncbi:DUF1573 domain-containing protein [Sphingobacterium bovistauri]|uniref:DUF1573 domain-containing protein n=1 Tax=Sphingobacterium bovistauri TaxID=2781959 RepID=A0ABS7Z8Y3_9SPHI|nr:DUF1573 domain-containing protein [Sphingobacterium bovistauri]MCA5005846.1 DUF1573 domain-containing protein [Sphingobacterium bovistauri]
MKKIVFAALALSVLLSCNNLSQKITNQQDTTALPNEENLIGGGKIAFVSDVFDFGTVKEGEIVEHTFKFTNEGTEPVILAQVSASCGCTTPDYTSEPVLPGKAGKINVSFNSAGQVGVQQKIVTVTSNAENNVVTVQLKGTVEK